MNELTSRWEDVALRESPQAVPEEPVRQESAPLEEAIAAFEALQAELQRVRYKNDAPFVELGLHRAGETVQAFPIIEGYSSFNRIQGGVVPFLINFNQDTREMSFTAQGDVLARSTEYELMGHQNTDRPSFFLPTKEPVVCGFDQPRKMAEAYLGEMLKGYMVHDPAFANVYYQRFKAFPAAATDGHAFERYLD